VPEVVIGQPASTEGQEQLNASQEVIAEVRTAGYALRVFPVAFLVSVECGANLMEDDRIDD